MLPSMWRSSLVCQPDIWRLTSVRICFGSPFSSEIVVCGHCLVTLSLTVNETLKWLSSLPTITQKSFWWWQCSERYIISLSPHLRNPSPAFSPSLISLVVSVDVKQRWNEIMCWPRPAVLNLAFVRNWPRSALPTVRFCCCCCCCCVFVFVVVVVVVVVFVCLLLPLSS